MNDQPSQNPITDSYGKPLRLPTVRELLEFAAAEASRAGNPEARIRATFGVSYARYNQMLFAAAETREALEVDAFTANRIQRIRKTRRAARTSITFRPARLI